MAVQQAPGLRRTDLQRHDLSASGREVVQNRVEIDPTAPARVDGQPPPTVEAGEVVFVPAETIHPVENVGGGNAAELATYVVEKGKPLLEVVE